MRTRKAFARAREALKGLNYAARRVWCGCVGHRWVHDESVPGRPSWCGRCNWWGGFTVMSIGSTRPRRRTIPRGRLALTFEERSTWGDCPVCRVPDGQPCISEIGLHLGSKADGSRLQTGEGAHLVRLRQAPEFVQVVAC